MKIVCAIFILIFNSSLAFSCTCIYARGLSDKEHSKYLKSVAAIFEGEVISLGEKRQITRKFGKGIVIEDTVQPIIFKVTRAWKGVDQPEIIVETDAASSCQFLPPIGAKIVIYAYPPREKSGALSINYCSTGVYDDEKMKREYGPGIVIEQPDAASTIEPRISMISMIWNRLVSLFS